MRTTATRKGTPDTRRAWIREAPRYRRDTRHILESKIHSEPRQRMNHSRAIGSEYQARCQTLIVERDIDVIIVTLTPVTRPTLSMHANLSHMRTASTVFSAIHPSSAPPTWSASNDSCAVPHSSYTRIPV